MLQTSIRQGRSLHLMVGLGVPVLPVLPVLVSVSVHALVADVVRLHVVSLPHVVADKLLHLDQVDGGGVAGAVGSSDAQVLCLLVAHTVGAVPLGVAQGRGHGLAQVQATVDTVSAPPAGSGLLPALPALLSSPVVMVSSAQRAALIAVADLMTRLSVSVMGRGGGRVACPASGVTIGEVGGACGRDANSWRQLFTGTQTSDLEALGRLDEGGQLRLQHLGLALVHEVEDALHLPAPHVLQHHYRVLAGILHKDLLEVGAAGRENHLVGPDSRVLAHDCAVHQGFILSKRNELIFFGMISTWYLWYEARKRRSILSPEEDCQMRWVDGFDGCSTGESNVDRAPCLGYSSQHHLKLQMNH